MREKSAEKNSARYRDTRVEIVVEDKKTGVLKCIGRIPGYRPTYLEDCLLTQKLIRHIHSEIKHLGVSNTMAEIKKNITPNITPRKFLSKLIIACVDTLSWCLSKSGGGGWGEVINKDL